MEAVAHHLKIEAQALPKGIERDCFGRSAFNRYYYAVFLDVKSALTSINSSRGELAHASIPEMLKGSIQKKLKNGRIQAIKSNDTELIKLCSRAIAATEALAKLLDEGRATRVTADYHPEIPVNFLTSRGDFQLNTVAVSDAQSWPHKARSLINTITTAWIQIGD